MHRESLGIKNELLNFFSINLFLHLTAGFGVLVAKLKLILRKVPVLARSGSENTILDVCTTPK